MALLVQPNDADELVFMVKNHTVYREKEREIEVKEKLELIMTSVKGSMKFCMSSMKERKKERNRERE